jgi:hypothetical protein
VVDETVELDDEGASDVVGVVVDEVDGRALPHPDNVDTTDSPSIASAVVARLILTIRPMLKRYFRARSGSSIPSNGRLSTTSWPSQRSSRSCQQKYTDPRWALAFGSNSRRVG